MSAPTAAASLQEGALSFLSGARAVPAALPLLPSPQAAHRRRRRRQQRERRDPAAPHCCHPWRMLTRTVPRPSQDGRA